MCNEAKQDNTLYGLVRVGIVTDVSGHNVRVKYPDLDMTSGWLPVLQHYDTDMDATASATASSYTSAETGETHTHTISVTVDVTHKYWMPDVNDTVVVVYVPVFNADGFVLGAIK